MVKGSVYGVLIHLCIIKGYGSPGMPGSVKLQIIHTYKLTDLFKPLVNGSTQRI